MPCYYQRECEARPAREPGSAYQGNASAAESDDGYRIDDPVFDLRVVGRAQESAVTNRARGGALAAQGTRKVVPDGEATGAIPLPVKDSWSCAGGSRDGRRRGCSARGKRRWAVAGGTVLRRGGRGLLGLGELECIECAGYAGSTH